MLKSGLLPYDPEPLPPYDPDLARRSWKARLRGKQLVEHSTKTGEGRGWLTLLGVAALAVLAWQVWRENKAKRKRQTETRGQQIELPTETSPNLWGPFNMG